MLVVETLEQGGLTVEEAGSFKEALAKIKDVGNELAAAVVDLGLPDRPGDGLVADLRTLRPDLPIILATGYASHDIRQRFAHDAMLQIVTKPFATDSLLAMLTKLGVRPRRADLP
jgi:CheY-like chemotaxis protein